METITKTLNTGIDVEPLMAFRAMVEKEPSNADRTPAVVAEWVGGDQSRIKMDGIETYLGGEGYLNPMKMLLACLAACDVDVVAMHASLLGIKIDALRIEATGHFNVQSYLGIEQCPGSGYNGISYSVFLSAPEITAEQIEALTDRCERSSPVGDSLSRAIPLKLNFLANA